MFGYILFAIKVNPCVEPMGLRNKLEAITTTLAQFRENNRAVADNRDGDINRSRRRANEVFLAFPSTIDVRSDEVSARLFSCNDCEVDLTEVVGLDQERTSLKRFKAVVIDGTAAGIMSSLPNFESQGKYRLPTDLGSSSEWFKGVQTRRCFVIFATSPANF